MYLRLENRCSPGIQLLLGVLDLYLQGGRNVGHKDRSWETQVPATVPVWVAGDGGRGHSGGRGGRRMEDLGQIWGKELLCTLSEVGGPGGCDGGAVHPN